MDNKTEIITIKPKIKQKGFKCENVKLIGLTDGDKKIQKRIKTLLISKHYADLKHTYKNIISKYTEGYNNKTKGKKLNIDQYILKGHELVEFANIYDEKVFDYLIYRYKYNMYPTLKILDAYPPCVQIEPVSICNYRCVFCYQSDKTFSDKKTGFMGHMHLNLFKQIVDELEGNVESITLASRGEPTLHKQLGEMLDYIKGKFLAVKINTNASMLTDKLIHQILASDIQTICFSIDAADKKLYEKLRVNGNFEKIIKRVKRFSEIKKNEYPNSRLTTRISGVKVNHNQNLSDMVNIWKPFADIIAFTNYTPWESSYTNEQNDITLPCTELWRRLFVWWDGKVNPCDYDYKSILSKWNAKQGSITKIWNSDYYNMLRKKHLNKERRDLEPCKKCISL